MLQNSIEINDIKLSFFLVLRKWFIISLLIVIGCISGFFYKKYIGTEYKSSLTFVLETSQNDNISAYAGIAAQFGIDLGKSGGGVFEGENLLELFRSKKIVIQTLLSNFDDNSDLLFVESYLNTTKSNSVNKIDFRKKYPENSNERRGIDSILNNVYNRITKSQLFIYRKDKKLSIVNLEFQGKDEIFAKKFIEKLCDNVVKFYSDYKTLKTNTSLAHLQNQADSLRNLLNNSIANSAQANDLNVNPLKQALKIIPRQRQIDETANTAMYTEILKQLALAKVTLLKETPLIQIIDTPTYPLEKVGPGKLIYAIYFSLIFGGCSFLYFFLIAYSNLIKQKK